MASTYIKRTQVSGSRNKFTFSAWVKRGAIETNQQILSCYHGNSDSGFIEFRFQGSGDSLHSSGYATNWFRTNRAFRDTNAWYHIVYAVDTTQATSGNRMKLYVNGVEETSFVTQTQPSQNFNLPFGESGSDIRIGINAAANAQFFDGSMSHVHFCDGYTYQPSDFGSTDATTGEWKINTSPSVSYGNNGFFILKDGNSVTDQSGQSHNCTVAGGTLTKTESSPSNVFATLNPLDYENRDVTLSNGNNTATFGGANDWSNHYGKSTLGMSSGKYYVESKIGNNATNQLYPLGIVDIDKTINSSIGDNGIGAYSTGSIYSASAEVQSGLGAWSNGDIAGAAFDATNGTLQFYKNGSTYGTQITSIDTSKTYSFCCNNYAGASVVNFNFGNGYFGTTAVSSAGTNASGIGIFEYDVPTNYTALSTKGINI
jgi:hypothetical protein